MLDSDYAAFDRLEELYGPVLLSGEQYQLVDVERNETVPTIRLTLRNEK
jgi:hypothetical protein